MEHFWLTMRDYNAQLKNKERENALHVLTRLLQVDKEEDEEEEQWGYRLAELLLEKGVDPNQPNRGKDPSLVYWAKHCADSTEELKLLLRYDADTNSADPQGNTCVHQLVYDGNDRALRAVAAAGGLHNFDFLRPNREGRSVFELARQQLNIAPNNASAAAIVLLLQKEGRAWQQRKRAEGGQNSAESQRRDEDAFQLTLQEEEIIAASRARAGERKKHKK
jgi:ankyrin repeat protein